MENFGLSVGLLVWLAFGAYALGFLFRDELILRSLVIVGSMFYMAYYWTAADVPLWDAIFSTTILLLINVVMCAWIIVERTTFTMSTETAAIYSQFTTLSPGQFRTLMRRATMHEPKTIEMLTREGAPVNHLYFVVNGPVEIGKGREWTTVEFPLFIGELSFLRGGSANATIRVSETSKYLSWRHDDLRVMMARKPAFHNAMLALFNFDMAEKVARSMPRGQRTAPLSDTASG